MSAPELPLDRIGRWLDQCGIAPGEPIAVEPIPVGASNVMYRIERGPLRMVLRRPAHVALERADDGMRREFRILSALEGTDVPHPGPLALCEDKSLLGCVFYVMQHVEGGSASALATSLDPRDMTNAVVDALAALHDVDWQARGLADLGRIDDFHERQVKRWRDQHARSNGREPERLAAVGEWLDRHLPQQWSPTIMHADYHMLNVIIAPDPPARVAAIVDWETATIGDPLLDLAGLLEVWTRSNRGPGWPTRGEMIQRYTSQRSLGQVPDLRYYEVLYNFRLCVLLEGVYQRSLRDSIRGPNEMASTQALVNLTRAEELMTAS